METIYNQEVAYINRLEKLNKDYFKREVIDSIDRPIRQLVIEMNRIGLKTKFSCCGFNYEGEEEPKTHHKDAYVIFYEPTTIMGNWALKNLLETFGNLENYSQGKWYARKLSMTNPSQQYEIKLHIPVWCKDMYNKNDRIEKSIHDYEWLVLGIHDMTLRLKNIPTDKEINNNEIEIIDGNKIYHDMGINEWQVKPKKTSFIKLNQQ